MRKLAIATVVKIGYDPRLKNGFRTDDRRALADRNPGEQSATVPLAVVLQWQAAVKEIDQTPISQSALRP